MHVGRIACESIPKAVSEISECEKWKVNNVSEALSGSLWNFTMNNAILDYTDCKAHQRGF